VAAGDRDLICNVDDGLSSENGGGRGQEGCGENGETHLVCWAVFSGIEEGESFRLVLKSCDRERFFKEWTTEVKVYQRFDGLKSGCLAGERRRGKQRWAEEPYKRWGD
jgi:hypothetical protein